MAAMNPSDASDRIEQAILGQSSDKIMVHGRKECGLAAQRFALQGQRQMDIFSYDLDAPLYNTEPFIKALKQLAIRSEHSRIRILLQDNSRVQKEGHRLLGLWRRLTSRIELRRPHPDFIDHPENFLLVDGHGYMQWNLSHRYEGVVNFHSPLQTRQYTEFFNEVWERSEPDSQLRDLHI
jgi:hypothetical protein